MVLPIDSFCVDFLYLHCSRRNWQSRCLNIENAIDVCTKITQNLFREESKKIGSEPFSNEKNATGLIQAVPYLSTKPKTKVISFSGIEIFIMTGPYLSPKTKVVSFSGIENFLMTGP